MIEAGGVKSLSELSVQTGVERSHLRATLHLAFLAPDIAQAILSGRQPRSLTLSALLNANLPVSWAAQRQLLRLI